jgi:SET family sugar efflux transporter-like MFS transporter
MLKQIEKNSTLTSEILPIFRIPGYNILAFLLFISGISTGLTTPFLPLFITQEINVSMAYLGYFTALSALSSIIISTVMGRISDYCTNRKNVLLMAAFSGAAGYYFFIFIRNYYSLLLISVVFIGISSAVTPQLFAYAGQLLDKSNPKNSPLAISILRIFPSIAWIICPTVGSLIIDKSDFNGLFMSVTVSYGFITLVMLVSLKNRSIKRERLSHVNKLQLHSNIVTLLCAFTILQTVNTISVINIPLFIVNILYGSSRDVGIIFSISTALEVPFMIWFGILSLKLSKGFIIRMGIISGILYFLGLVFSTKIWNVILIQLFNSCFVSSFVGLGISCFQDLIPKEYGTSTTLYNNTIRLGSIIGGLITSSIGALLGVRAVFLVCVGSSLIAFLLYLFSYG